MTTDSPNEATGAERIPAPYPAASPLWVLLSRWLLALEAWLRSHGGRRLRFGLRAFWGAVAVAGVVLLVGPVINPPLTLDDITSSADTVTDRWIAREFAVDYRIERSTDGTLVAHVEERIGAFFPDGTDEPGIQRALATQYQGHDLALSNITATMDGAAIEVQRAQTPDRETLTLDAPGNGPRSGTGNATGTTDAAPLTGDHAFVLRYDLANLAYETTDTATDQPVDLLQWNVFGPSWPQGFAGLDVSITLPQELDDRLVRQPRGNLAWTLLSAGEWLEPEAGGAAGGAPGDVTYRFMNDQNIPPHAEAWFTMNFQPGTFRMPDPTPLFWVQTFGPVAPLAFLAITLLLAFAARRVAWSDARGRPWFVSQSEPPEGVSPETAAAVLQRPRALELAGSLDRVQSGVAHRRKPAPDAAGTDDATFTKTGALKRKSRSRASRAAADRRGRLVDAARVAHRTGRIGDLPRALARYSAAPARRALQATGLRRIPRGFVRDLFIAAPLALTLVQWGIVRQLSHQAKLSIVWWPVAFVLVSTVVAVIVLAIALSARPLTRRGALLKQHLQGIGVYADRTRLLERAPTNDSLLPFAVLLAPPREAGERVVGLIEGELDDGSGSSSSSGSDWRTPGFLTWPRLGLRALALLLVAGAIVAVSVLPNPYDRGDDFASFSGDIPGTIDTKVTSMDAVADLSRTADGHARLAVTEQLTVTFGDEGSRVPQFVQEWPSIQNHQNLGLTVRSVTIDGADVPFATEQRPNTVLMRTTLGDVLTGAHDVQLSYELESAAVAAEQAGRAGDAGQGGAAVDRIRWTALLDGWQYDSAWGDEPAPDPLRLQLRMPASLAGDVTDGGWLTLDTDSSDSPSDWAPAVVPFDSPEYTSAAGSQAADRSGTTSNTSTDAGTVLHVLDLRGGDLDTGYPFDLTVDGTGAALDFPAGTFAGPDPAALRLEQFGAVAPLLVVVLLAALAVVFGVLGAVQGARRRPRIFVPGLLRDLVWWLAPAATLATTILFFWMTIDMPADDGDFVPLALATLAALAASVAGLVLTRRSRRPAAG
ncbi:DUF2207 domain-containing protein [Subtercola sp. Z020]|uniref:DUF2207 domain-containing protein n=1 Tax=Subtercola sp. Z020 TaxID=2080582 RepID=UPI00130EDC18|nr:DUF2207 domain-containing protein [Subtercola sp. Z020]